MYNFIIAKENFVSCCINNNNYYSVACIYLFLKKSD